MKLFFITAFLVISFEGKVLAQQTIFDVPSTDVLEKGKVYVELDAAFKPNDKQNVKKFSSFVPRIVVGAGGKVEIGLNVTGNIQPGMDSYALVPTVKWKVYDGKDNGWAVVFGNNLFVPVRNKSYNAGNYSYTAFSKTINKTRVTAGGYYFTSNVVAPNAQRAGGQFGLEQSINGKLTFAADWITGKHVSGYFTHGLIYKPHPKVTSYFSYSIGNTNVSRGNHFFLFEIGFNLN